MPLLHCRRPSQRGDEYAERATNPRMALCRIIKIGDALIRIPVARMYLAAAMVVFVAACTPLTAVSMVGSTVARAAERANSDEAKRAARRKDDAVLANLNVGVEYIRRGQYEKALAKLIKARAGRPDYAPTYSALGVLYQRLDRFDEAERNFRKSLRLDKKNSDMLNNYAQFLCAQDRESEAEKYFLKAAKNPLNETPEVPYANAGTCAHLHGRTDVAAGYFRQALLRNPNIPVALIRMAEISFRDGEMQQAHDYLTRYSAVAQHTPQSLWLGIRIEDQLGDLDKVSSYALLLRNKFPDTEEARQLTKSGLR